MKITYDRQVDIIQITLKEVAIAESGEETHRPLAYLETVKVFGHFSNASFP